MVIKLSTNLVNFDSFLRFLYNFVLRFITTRYTEMRIPHEINKSVIEAYAVPDCILRKQTFRIDEFTWDSGLILSLRDLVLRAIAKDWEKNPIYFEIDLEEDRHHLLELLSTDLPVEITVPLLDNDYYWEKCYLQRWPDLPPPNKRVKFEKIIPTLKSIDTERDKFKLKNINAETEMEGHKKSQDQTYSETIIRKRLSTLAENKMGMHDTCLNYVFVEKTWKQCFSEKYMALELENMSPILYNPEHITDLTNLFGSYVNILKIDQLKQCKHEESTDHISLYTLLTNLPKLREFSVCFTQMNLVENFTWHSRKISDADCKFLGLGVAKSKLKILRVVRSDINCENVKYILQPLVNHYSLRVLDFSYCKIADEGAKSIAALLTSTPNIDSLILVANAIGPKGAHAIGYYLCQPESSLIKLNLKLNPLGVEGGHALLTALVRGNKTVRYISLAACGFSSELIHIGKALQMITNIRHINLSNNNFGPIIGDNILQALRNNTFITQFDLRMCGIPDTTLKEIDMICRNNLLKKRYATKYPPYMQDLI